MITICYLFSVKQNPKPISLSKQCGPLKRSLRINRDKEIIRQIQKSNTGAFKELYFLYAERIFRFLVRRINNPEIAKDLVQEIFASLWRNRFELDEKKSLESYMFRAATNASIDHLRKKIAHQKIVMEMPQNDIVFVKDDQVDLKEMIDRAIQNLPEAQRKVFILSRYEQLKYKEISEILGISVKTIENHINSALKKLRKSLISLITNLINMFVF